MLWAWSRLPAALVIGLLLLTVGCGSSTIDPPRYPVKGKVLFKGKPTPHAIVCFIPADSSSELEPAAGVADSEGNFELLTRKHLNGAEAGDYLVTVSWQIPKNPNSSEEPNYGPELLPKKFQDPATSNLKATVEAEDNDLPPFELKP